MGWTHVRNQRGATISGSRSVRYRSISKLAEPAPMMAAARNSTDGTPEVRNRRPTCAREAR